MVDDLSSPLKSPRARRAAAEAARAAAPRSLWHRLPVARTLLALTAVVIGIMVYAVMTGGGSTGGRPQTEAAITHSLPANSVAETAALPAPPPGTLDVQQIPGGAKVIKVDPSLASGLDDTALTGSMGVYADLAEDTANGPIPRISASGETPFSVYRRPSVDRAMASRPLVAIVVTGLGLNERGTTEAIAALPGEVTLGFAPYGKTLDITVADARADGHELLLEIPLEPFDYPDNDPGPDTLLTGQSARANLERLFRLMARMGGYVGIINHMGGRFTASGGDFAPVMEELGTRGLGYLDDGSSNRSVAPQLAGQNKVPFGRASLQLDASPSRSAILAALDELVEKARKDGHAIGIASALPVSVNTIGEWARTAEDKGVLLVPVSALMQ